MADLTVTALNTNIVSRGLTSFSNDEDPEYIYFKAVAESEVAKSLPSDMGASMAAHCTMLMICHLYASTPETGMRSFSNGDFSGSQDAGETIYLKEFHRIIDGFQTDTSSSTSTSTTRADASMSDFKLDQVDLPTFFRD